MADEPSNSSSNSSGSPDMEEDRLAAYQSKNQEPSLRVLEFSDQTPIMTVSTALRRLWLLDPASRTMDADIGESELQPLFKSSLIEMVRLMYDAPESERYDDQIWRLRESPQLLDPPLVMASAVEASKPANSAFSPWRQETYRNYAHVFHDMHGIAKGLEERVGDFNAEVGVVIGNPPVAGENQSEQHLMIRRDTFVYPAWVYPGCKVSLRVGEETYTFSSDGSSWTQVLWLKASQTLRILHEMPSNNEITVASAVLVFCKCEPRKPTLGLEKSSWPPASGNKSEMPGLTDDDKPAFYPERDHLARAIFLKAGEAIDRCTYDELYSESDQEACLDEPEKQKPDPTPSLYQQLPTDKSTRLLIVEPGTKNDSLETRLVVVELDQSPVYEAISYTWGAPTDQIPLVCGGSSVMVPRNLDLALRHIRRPDRRLYLWADAVCINQSDIPERSQQVSIMRHIFRAAKRVLAWLGPDEQGIASKAFGTVCPIVRLWRDSIGENKFKFLNYRSALEGLDPTEAIQLRDQLDTDGWAALQAMFQAELFRRFWIIQELALAQNAVVVWGDHCISWGLVGVCAAWLLTKGWMFNLESTEKPPEAAPSSSVAAFNAFLTYAFPLGGRSAISSFSKIDLSAMLGATVEIFHSTDPRDRIYALLGMSFAGNDPSTDAFLVQPDYSKSVQEVYTDASRRILKQDQHLRLLSSVQHCSSESIGSEDYPSWVPRWDQAQLVEPLALRQEGGYYANAGELFFPSEETFGEDGKSLIVTGLKCSSVTSVSKSVVNASTFQNLSSLAELDEEAAGMFLILSQLADVERQFRSTWSSNVEQSTLAGFNNPDAQEQATQAGLRLAATTAIPGKYDFRESTEILTGEKAQTDHLSDIMLSWRERNSWFTVGSELRKIQESLQYGDSGDEDSAAKSLRTEIMLSAINVMVGRKVFRCDDGGVGIGPAAMKDGDVIAVLFGGIIPYVLRPLDEDRWQLVGECFVPGLMQGEAVEEAGLLMPDSYDRGTDRTRSLRLHPCGVGDYDPRFHRKVGEHGIRRFEIR